MTEALNAQTETEIIDENSDRRMVERLESTLAEHLENSASTILTGRCR